MNKIITSILLVLNIIISTHYVFAQQGSVIDSLKIIPTNPTTNENIKLICYTTFSSGACELNDYSVNIQNAEITVMTNYTVGDNTAICHSVDTLTIGTLDSGNYKLTTSLTVNLLNAIFDTDTINFTVDNVLSVSETELDNDINIYPNPFANELQIKVNTTKNLTSLEIYSATGTKIKQVKFNHSERINVSDLTNGIYLIVLTDKNGNRYTRKMIKNAL
jgi:hypothetical protein